jgi:ribosome-binding factor A
MSNIRINKIARLIQKELSDIFLRYSSSLFSGTLISVTIVRVSPDLALVKAFLSIFPTEKSKEVIESIEENKKTIRHELAQKVKNQLRIVPELAFFLDDSLDYIENIERLLKT